jgi:hypothetical protein
MLLTVYSDSIVVVQLFLELSITSVEELLKEKRFLVIISTI